MNTASAKTASMSSSGTVGAAHLRIALSTAHTREQADALLSALQSVLPPEICAAASQATGAAQERVLR